jgi:hypothetical protein
VVVTKELFYLTLRIADDRAELYLEFGGESEEWLVRRSVGPVQSNYTESD